MSNQYTSNPWDVVTRIECIPTSTNVGFEPAGEIPWAIWGRRAHVAQISGAISGRNVQAAAECDSQVRVVATNAFALVKDLPRRLGCARVFIAELNVVMYKIASEGYMDVRVCTPRGRVLQSDELDELEPQQEMDIMAKGQQRGNREAKKPKKEKAKVIAAAPSRKEAAWQPDFGPAKKK